MGAFFPFSSSFQSLVFHVACRLNLHLCLYEFLPFPARRIAPYEQATTKQAANLENGVHHG